MRPWPWALPPSFLPTSRAVRPAALCLRGCARFGAGRPPPLRGAAPAFSPKGGPGPGPFPPGSFARALRRADALPRPLAAAPALCFPSLRCGLPVVALAVLGAALALRVGSPGPPVLAPSGLWGSARSLPVAPGGFGPGGFLARGGAARWAAFLRLAPGSFFVLGCVAPCAVPFSGGALFRWGSPPAPPARRPPPGGSGCAWPCWGACGPPCRFAARLPRGCATQVRPPAAWSPPALFSAPGLDKAGPVRYDVGAWPARALRRSARKGVR